MARKGRLSVPLTIAIMVVGTALFPVLLPVALVQLARDKRRLQAAARGTTCIACGCLLTHEALTRAGTMWAAHIAQLRRDHPTVMFRVVRPYDAVCIACGQGYKWQSEARVLQPVQAAKSPA